MRMSARRLIFRLTPTLYASNHVSCVVEAEIDGGEG